MRKKFQPIARSGLVGAVCLTALQYQAALAQVSDVTLASFQIESQPLAKALMKYSEQSQIVVVAPTDMVKGKTSSEVGGDLAPEMALDQLLKGTGLALQANNNGALTLKVDVAETQEAGVPRPFLMAQLESPAPQASPPTTEPAEDQRSIQDTIIVTGIRGAPRSVIDSPTPIDVFTAEDIQQGSPTGIFEAIRYLVPSFNLPTRGGGGTATIIATGGLRGLNPDQTLVLVNGKRRHKTALINSVSSLYNGAAGVDLNMIPSSAIARIEVLRDGAAAQYGSDAIAGVINVILKEDTEGGEASVSYGQNFDRGDGESLTASANQGIALGDKGFLNLSYSYMDRDESNRAVPISSDIDLYYPLADGSRDPREDIIDRTVTQNYGAFPQKSDIFSANLAYDLGGVEAYAFGTYGARTSILNWSFRSPTRDVALPEVYPNGFRPRLTIIEDDYEVAGGFRGELESGWAWDMSSNYGSDITDWENSNGLNASLGPASPTFFEVGRLIASEWTNAIDITKAHSLAGGGELQTSFGLQHRWENYKVEAGDEASYAAGSYVRPADQPYAGQLLAPGSQATPGFRPDDEADATRTNLSGYAELGWTPTEKLFLGAAARYEYFDDDSGDTTIFKVNGRYELTDWLAFRSSYNTGFRAPTLAQQSYSSTTSQFRDLDGDGETELLLLKNLPVNSPAAVALGSTPLTPETSKNFSIGFTATPFENFTLTVDAYQIDVDDRIAVTTTFSPLDTALSADGVTTIGDQIQAILVANNVSSEVSGQYYTNAIDTRTKGLDVVATYRLATDYGDFQFNAGYNQNDAEITGIVDNPSELASLGDIVIFDRSKQGAITDSLPDSKITLGANWDIGKLTANVRATRFGSYTVRNASNPAADYSIDPAWIADFEIGYEFTEAFSLFAGANNIFNEYPDEVREPGVTSGSNMYDTLAPFGFTGGSWFARGVYKW